MRSNIEFKLTCANCGKELEADSDNSKNDPAFKRRGLNALKSTNTYAN